MSSERSAELAVGWIEAWTRLDINSLRQWLSPDFVHTSPFGTLEGREFYLATVEPLARKSVMELTIKDVVSSGNRAVVWFENRTPKGVVPSCDWLRIENDVIKEVRSFYDSLSVREALSPTEQKRLEGDS